MACVNPREQDAYNCRFLTRLELMVSVLHCLDDIGIVKDVHDRGFGFATGLTGEKSKDVFLNESRIARLSKSEPVVGRLIRMSVVKQASGKLAASRADLLRFDSTDVAELLWAHLRRSGLAEEAIQKLRAIHAGRAASLPFILLFARVAPEINVHLKPLANEIPLELWLEAELTPALYLAPNEIRRHVIESQIKRQPSLALESLTQLAMADGWVCQEEWLDILWTALPDSRPVVMKMFRTTARKASFVPNPFQWACRGLEVGQEIDELWEILERDIRNGSCSAETIPENWDAITAAPWSALEAICRERVPALSDVLDALSKIRLPSSSMAAANAEDFLALNETDQRLSELWVGPSVNQQMHGALRAQMMTARSAEKCAKLYFERLGLQVDDIAIQQIDSPSGEWRVMDLKVGGQFGVDVKNLRRTPNGGMRSSKWRVKSFKSDARGSEVLLCGVSSPYSTFVEDTLSCDSGEIMLVLGVTTASEVKSLLREFCQIHVVRVNPATKVFELPVWAWDYPLAHYRERDQAFSRLRATFQDRQTSRLMNKCLEAIPLALLAMWAYPPTASDELSPQQSAMLDMLREFLVARAASGKSATPRLPWLYLFLLHFWMYWRATSESINTAELVPLFEWKFSFPAAPTATWRTSRRILFANASSKFELPSLASSLGIVDPSNSIRTLINALTSLEEHVSRRLFLRLSDLTLHENGVFVGTFPDGRRKTLLAHCGGKRQDLSECGFRPLVYGRHQTCGCGRLICPKCDSCSDARFAQCEQQAKRHAERDPTRDV